MQAGGDLREAGAGRDDADEPRGDGHPAAGEPAGGLGQVQVRANPL